MTSDCRTAAIEKAPVAAFDAVDSSLRVPALRASQNTIIDRLKPEGINF